MSICVVRINGEVQVWPATVTRHNDDGTCDANVEFPGDTLDSLWRHGGTVEFFAVAAPQEEGKA